MGRTIRLNTASGGAAVTTSISLEDVAAAFNAPRHLKTFSLEAATTVLEFDELDIETYSHFYVKMDHISATTNGHLFIGPMSGGTKHTSVAWTGNWDVYGSYTNSSNTNTTGQPSFTSSNWIYANSSDHNHCADIEVVFPEASYGGGTTNPITANIWYRNGRTGGYQGQSYQADCSFHSPAQPDGFYLSYSNGSFYNSSANQPMVVSLYGGLRRTAS